ncbi:putative Adenosine deaminase [Blattamonas nauphoetae]|uniref:adenosine deaminase n=1 Tax=Blattamonas nauphoetae TaxID=2049346 RepID=A0ABQ9YM38_9EUKA|nr:putative Adenosine deaminase [Blattamonas nauphoetae]
MEFVVQKRPQPRKLTLAEIRQLPKAELHCHLDGSIRVKTVLELAAEQGVVLPTTDEKELSALLNVAEDCPSLVEYLRAFDITLLVLQRPYAITRTVYEIAEDCVNDGTTYIEIRFAPILHTNKGHSLSEIVKAAIEGKMLAEQRLPIVVRIIVCAMRQLSSDDSVNAAEIAWRYRDQGIVALDTAGPENGFSSVLHQEAFDIVRKNNLNCTLHAGEAAGWESVHDSIRYCGAHRIGHGVRIKENKQLVQYIINHQISIESCVTSNVQTKAVASLKEHPIREYFDQGIVICPCTDNTTVSNVTLSSEYYRLHHELDFSIEELVVLIDNGFRSTFTSFAHKQRMRIDALRKCCVVLKKCGFDISGLEAGFPNFERIPSSIVPVSNQKSYWENYTNPKITADVLKQIPKVDLNIRLVGSMSLEKLWELTQKLPAEEKTTVRKYFTSFQELQAFYETKKDPKSYFSVSKAKEHYLDVLQQEYELSEAIDDIYRHSKEDNITYLEMVVRPKDHIRKNLSCEDVISIVLREKDKADKKYGIRSKVVLSVHNPEDDPVVYVEMAQLAIKFREKGVGAFGVLGDDILPQNTRFFAAAFDLLKNAHLPIVMSCARKIPKSAAQAMHSITANRLSGCFSIHHSPHLVKYIADRQMPVELSSTEHLREHNSQVQSFAGNVVRFLVDSGVPVVICSFARTCEAVTGLSNVYASLVADCGLSISEVLMLMENAIRSSNLDWHERKLMEKDFKETSAKILEGHKFHQLNKKAIFPETLTVEPTIPHVSGTTEQNTLITPRGEVRQFQGGSSHMLLKDE